LIFTYHHIGISLPSNKNGIVVDRRDLVVIGLNQFGDISLKANKNITRSARNLYNPCPVQRNPKLSRNQGFDILFDAREFF
jgi:hypothetical protein